MSNRTRPPEKGGDTGFRRLPKYAHVISPYDLRVLLDPQQEDMPRQEEVRSSLTKTQRTSLEAINKQADKIKLFDADRMKDQCGQDLAFACALDQPNPKARLYAMLARAYARADQFAAACADELEVRAHGPKLAASLDKALKALVGPNNVLWDKSSELYEMSNIKKALISYERMTSWRAVVTATRSEDLYRGLMALYELHEGLNSILSKRSNALELTGPAYGWASNDEARYFFVLRLAEVFTISTGKIPPFSGWYLKETPWNIFVRSALNLTKLRDNNFDELSRRLGGREAGMRHKGSKNNSHFFKDISKWFFHNSSAADTYKSNKCTGSLMSTADAIDRHDGEDPWNWMEQMEKIHPSRARLYENNNN